MCRVEIFVIFANGLTLSENAESLEDIPITGI